MNNTKKLTIASFGVVVNLVLGSIVGMLKIPLLFLDTIGTIFTAVILGPWYGALTGGVSNLLLAIFKNPKDAPFLLVNVVVGIVVGLIARKYKFNLKTAVITGLILAVVAPLIGTPIAIWVYGGITGDFNDFFYTWLKNSGSTVFSSAFIPRITSNLVDKIASSVIVSLTYLRVLKALNISESELKNEKK